MLQKIRLKAIIIIPIHRSVMRHQTLLSPLISTSKNALLTSTRGTLAAAGGGFTNALLVSESVARFPLLPIVLPTVVGGQLAASVAQRAASMVSSSLIDTATASHHQSVAGPSLKVPSAKANRKRDKSPVTKAAGSFFEAMSSSWFGTSK